MSWPPFFHITHNLVESITEIIASLSTKHQNIAITKSCIYQEELVLVVYFEAWVIEERFSMMKSDYEKPFYQATETTPV